MSLNNESNDFNDMRALAFKEDVFNLRAYTGDEFFLTEDDLTSLSDFNHYILGITAPLFKNIPLFLPQTEISLFNEISAENFEFLLIDSLKANAMTFQADISLSNKGYVFLTKGLFNLAQNEAELIGVLAHEISHHIINKIKQHHEFDELYSTDKAEEMNADILACNLLKSINLHPKHYLNILDKLTQDEKKNNNLSTTDLSTVFDPHPSREIRLDIIRIWLEKNAVNLLNIQQNPPKISQDITDKIKAISSFEKSVDNFLASLDTSLSKEDKFNRYLDFLNSKKITLYSDEKITHSFFHKHIWNKFLTKHRLPEEKRAKFPKISRTKGIYRYEYISPIYLKEAEAFDLSFYKFFDTVNLFMNKQDEENLIFSEYYNYISSSLERLFEDPILTPTPQQKTNHNVSFYKDIEDLFTAQKPMQEAMNNLENHPDFKRLIKLMDFYDLKIKVARPFLNPYKEAFKIGKTIPLRPLIIQMKKHTPRTQTQSFYDDNVSGLGRGLLPIKFDAEVYQENLYTFLADLGFYDSQAFVFKKGEYMVLPKYFPNYFEQNLLTPKEENFDSDFYQKTADTHLFVHRINEYEMYVYTYDNNYKILSSEHFSTKDSSVFNADAFCFSRYAENLVAELSSYRADIYKKVTQERNTLFHYIVLEEYHTLQQKIKEKNTSLVALTDLANRLNNLSLFALTDTFAPQDLNLIPKEITWSISTNKHQRIKKDFVPEDKMYLYTDRDRFFDFLTHENDSGKLFDLTILKGYCFVVSALLKGLKQDKNNQEAQALLTHILSNSNFFKLSNIANKMDAETNNHPALLFFNLLSKAPVLAQMPDNYFDNFKNNRPHTLFLLGAKSPKILRKMLNYDTPPQNQDEFKKLEEKLKAFFNEYEEKYTLPYSFFAFEWVNYTILAEQYHWLKNKKNTFSLNKLVGLASDFSYLISQDRLEYYIPDILLEEMQDLIHERLNAPFDLKDKFFDLSDLIDNLEKAHRTDALSFAEELNILQNLCPAYLNLIQEQTETIEKVKLIKKAQSLSNLYRYILSHSKDIFSGDLLKQADLYESLCFYGFFRDENSTQKEILTHLIQQIKKEPLLIQEIASFFLLSDRVGLSFVKETEELKNIWIQSVVKLIGMKDDSSKAFLDKLTPFAQKLLSDTSGIRSVKNKFTIKNGKPVYDSFYIYNLSHTRVSLDIQKSLSQKLQKELVTQREASFLLEPKGYFDGIFSSKIKTDLIGVGTDLVSLIFSQDEKHAEELLDFLLVKELNSQSIRKIHNYFREVCSRNNITYSFSQDLWGIFYENFWQKPFEIRTALITSLYNRAFKNEKLKHIDMLNRILPSGIAFETECYNLLLNYAAAVEKDESYRTTFLLAACLAVNKPNYNNTSLAKIIRLFLESQGPAGIKTGQMLSCANNIPSDIKEELLKLTNHALEPSRAEVFRLLQTYHPTVFDEVSQKGLGKIIGSASHYITLELNENEVLSIAREHSDLNAELVYRRLEKALQTSIKQNTFNNTLFLSILDTVKQAHALNRLELNGNVGYLQSLYAGYLYDNVEADIEGFHIRFKNMPWTRMPEAYRCYVKENHTFYNQSYKIMQKARGIDYPDLATDKSTLSLPMAQQQKIKTACAMANALLNIRMILKGSVFDDDRHQGQLKVEIQDAKNIVINLFDSGAMSIKSPTTSERKMLGTLIGKTLNTLLFEKKETNQNMADVFYQSVENIRNEKGTLPLYIAKTVRAVSNLQHFLTDIPKESYPLLGLALLKIIPEVHPEILTGIRDTLPQQHQQTFDWLIKGATNFTGLNKPSDTEIITAFLSEPLPENLQKMVLKQLSPLQQKGFSLALKAKQKTPKLLATLILKLLKKNTYFEEGIKALQTLQITPCSFNGKADKKLLRRVVNKNNASVSAQIQTVANMIQKKR